MGGMAEITNHSAGVVDTSAVVQLLHRGKRHAADVLG